MTFQERDLLLLPSVFEDRFDAILARVDAGYQSFVTSLQVERTQLRSLFQEFKQHLSLSSSSSSSSSPTAPSFASVTTSSVDVARWKKLEERQTSILSNLATIEGKCTSLVSVFHAPASCTVSNSPLEPVTPKASSVKASPQQKQQSPKKQNQPQQTKPKSPSHPPQQQTKSKGQSETRKGEVSSEWQKLAAKQDGILSSLSSLSQRVDAVDSAIKLRARQQIIVKELEALDQRLAVLTKKTAPTTLTPTLTVSSPSKPKSVEVGKKEQPTKHQQQQQQPVSKVSKKQESGKKEIVSTPAKIGEKKVEVSKAPDTHSPLSNSILYYSVISSHQSTSKVTKVEPVVEASSVSTVSALVKEVKEEPKLKETTEKKAEKRDDEYELVKAPISFNSAFYFSALTAKAKEPTTTAATKEESTPLEKEVAVQQREDLQEPKQLASETSSSSTSSLDSSSPAKQTSVHNDILYYGVLSGSVMKKLTPTEQPKTLAATEKEQADEQQPLPKEVEPTKEALSTPGVAPAVPVEDRVDNKVPPSFPPVDATVTPAPTPASSKAKGSSPSPSPVGQRRGTPSSPKPAARSKNLSVSPPPERREPKGSPASPPEGSLSPPAPAGQGQSKKARRRRRKSQLAAGAVEAKTYRIFPGGRRALVARNLPDLSVAEEPLPVTEYKKMMAEREALKASEETQQEVEEHKVEVEAPTTLPAVVARGVNPLAPLAGFNPGALKATLKKTPSSGVSMPLPLPLPGAGMDMGALRAGLRKSQPKAEPEQDTSPPDTPPKPKPSELKKAGGVLPGSSSNLLQQSGGPSAGAKPQIARGGPLAGMDVGALRGGLKKRS